MKKQVWISNCYQCRFYGHINMSNHGCIKKNKRLLSEDGIEIPEWCPLEDADNEETHYMVPKPFLRVIYSTISGIITKKELDDSLSEADDALWMIREKIKNITGHGD